jgi:hypothetical protein
MALIAPLAAVGSARYVELVLTLTFLVVVATLPAIGAAVGVQVDPLLLIALLVCLIPTTIGGLLPAIGIAGMNRALAANVLAKSGKAVEVAGDVDVLLLDKTGTITYGDRQASHFHPLAGIDASQLREAALLSSLADPTPEGKSIVRLAREMDLLTTPYAFDEAEALAMADAGADVVVAHMGCTSGGSIGPKSVVPLDECARRVARIADAVKRRRPEVLVLCHGGAISSPDDAQVVLSAVPACDGFYGASSTERLPTEIAIRDTIRRFMDLRLAPVKET